MPYRVRHGLGKRPFQIINLQTGKVVGTSTSRDLATRSIAHRMSAEPSEDIKLHTSKAA